MDRQVSNLNMRKPTFDGRVTEVEAPAFDPSEMGGVMPADFYTKELDMRKVLARILDGSKFDEFKAGCGHGTY